MASKYARVHFRLCWQIFVLVYRIGLNQNGVRNCVAYLWTQVHPWCINWGKLQVTTLPHFKFKFWLSYRTTMYDSRCEVRPQPSWDRTCTAAAAIGLLYELKQLAEFSSFELDKQGEAIDNALEVLFEALIARRLRRGRSISRKERHNWDIW